MAFLFENLQIYRKAVAFADAVCTLTKGFPRGYFFLADQLNRAALSIAANIAENTIGTRSILPPAPAAGVAHPARRQCRSAR